MTLQSLLLGDIISQATLMQVPSSFEHHIGLNSVNSRREQMGETEV